MGLARGILVGATHVIAGIAEILADCVTGVPDFVSHVVAVELADAFLDLLLAFAIDALGVVHAMYLRFAGTAGSVNATGPLTLGPGRLRRGPPDRGCRLHRSCMAWRGAGVTWVQVRSGTHRWTLKSPRA